MHGRNIRFRKDLKQGCLDEKPIPKPLREREFSLMHLLGIYLNREAAMLEGVVSHNNTIFGETFWLEQAVT